MERKRGIIFDMDGALVDAMPFHCEAIKTAASQEVDIDVERRDVYLLEGMPGEDMVKQLLREKRYTGNIEELSDDNSEKLDSIAHRIHERKKTIFKKVNASAPLEGAKELVSSLRCK